MINVDFNNLCLKKNPTKRAYTSTHVNMYSVKYLKKCFF